MRYSIEQDSKHISILGKTPRPEISRLDGPMYARNATSAMWRVTSVSRRPEITQPRRAAVRAAGSAGNGPCPTRPNAAVGNCVIILVYHPRHGSPPIRAAGMTAVSAGRAEELPDYRPDWPEGAADHARCAERQM